MWLRANDYRRARRKLRLVLLVLMLLVVLVHGVAISLGHPTLLRKVGHVRARDGRNSPGRPDDEHTGRKGFGRPVAGGTVGSLGDGAIDGGVAWAKNEQAERFAEYAMALPADDGSSCRRLTV